MTWSGNDNRNLFIKSLNKSCKPLAVACRIGSLEIVNWLLENGAVVDYFDNEPPIIFWPVFGSPLDRYQSSALIEACRGGHLEIVKLLIEHDADINLVTPHETALHEACRHGNLEMVKLLLEQCRCKQMLQDNTTVQDHLLFKFPTLYYQTAWEIQTIGNLLLQQLSTFCMSPFAFQFNCTVIHFLDRKIIRAILRNDDQRTVSA